MILAALVATLALGVPDVSRRTPAYRVLDVIDATYDCTQACTQPQNATRDTFCMQAAINAAATTPGDAFAAVEMPTGYCYINDSLTVDSEWGFELFGRGVNNTQLVWVGVAPVNILELYDVRQANIHDFSVYVTTTDADAAIASFNGSGTTVAPTANRFHDLYIEASGGAALADGLRFDDTGPGGDNNQEFYSIERVHVGGYQSNAFNIMGGQMKGTHFADSTCASDAAAPASTCVTSYGCFDWQGGGGGANTYADFSLMNNGCPYVIANANFEQSYRLLYVPGPTGAQTYVTITGTRWSSIGGIARGAAGDARRVVKFLGSGGLTMIGNTIGDDGAGTYAMTANAATDVITLTGSPDLVVDTPMYFTTSGGLPAGLSTGTTYYVKTAPTSTTATLSTTVGGATVNITSAGTGTHTATISNFRPLSFYLYRATVSAPYVFLNNNIGTNLTGSDLWSYATPTMAVGNTIPDTTSPSGAMGSAVSLPAGPLLVGTIDEDVSGAGVTIEGVRLEDVGTNTYEFDVGTAASTLNVMANGDTAGPYSLTARLYGDLYVYGTDHADTINEVTPGEGVTIDDTRLESEGSGIYALDVHPGGSGSKTLRLMASTDTSNPYSLSAEVYGDLDVKGALYIAGANVSDRGVVYVTSSVSDVTYTNSNTETTLKTLTIPGGTLKAGDMITQKCFGLVTSYASGSPTSRTAINSTGGALSNYANLAVAANGDGMEVETTYFVQTIGASGEIHGFGSTHTLLTGSGMTQAGVAQAHDQTVDTTANIDLLWSMQWSTTSASNIFVGKGCSVVVYRPN